MPRKFHANGAARWVAGGLGLMACGAAAAAEPTVLGSIVVEEEIEDSYLDESASTATKLPLSRIEIPMSVSVLTRAQMDAQNMVTTWDALQQITGVQAVSNDLTQSQFHARGTALDVQLDGVPGGIQLSGYKQFDLSIYDRIEVQRGPAGLLQGSGSFGGTVNLIRKRATRERHGSLLASAGTWNNLRAEADLSSPLNAAGTLRARAVASFVDRDFVFDRVHSRKRLAYLTADYDFTDNTTATAYFAWQDDKGPGFSGLPTYTNGRFLDVPRSFNHHPEWNRMSWDTREIGLEMRHRWGEDWQLTARANRRDQTLMFHDGYTNTGVDPVTYTARYSRREATYHSDAPTLDAFVSGGITLFGRRHDVLLGYNQALWTSTGRSVTPTQDASLFVPGVLVASPPDLPEPGFTYRTGIEDTRRQHGFYTQLRARITDSLSLLAGGRLTRFTERAHDIAPSPPTEWERGAHISGEFTPFAGVTWSPANNWSIYGSYAEVFVPQTQLRATGEVLDPRVGRQFEVGAKADLAGGLLHTTLALFNIRDRNRSFADEDNPGFFLPLGLAESEGVEFEIVGRPARGWDISTGYTYLATRHLRHTSQEGQPLSGWYPKHSLKLWGSHTFQGGILDGLRVGAGVRAQGRTVGGASTASATVQARRQGGYAVTSLYGAYALPSGIVVGVNIDNLFDTHYYTRLGGLNSYNTFGDPRSATLSVKWAF